MTPLVVLVPIRTVAETNEREHWSRRHKRRKAQREAVAWSLAPHQAAMVVFAKRWIVTITRVAPRPLDGHDNLRSGLKATADEVARWLGVDDGSDAVEWRYGQRRGRVREYAVEVRIEAAESAAVAAGGDG